MGALRITTINGEETVLHESAIDALKANLRGELITPHGAGYDEAALSGMP